MISVFDILVVDCITCFIFARFSIVHGALKFPLFLSYFVF